MIEIVIAAVTALLIFLMATRRRFKRGTSFARYIPGNVQLDINMTTLAASTGVLAATDTVDDTTRISSIKASYSLAGVTPVNGAGPILIGVAHSDYSLAEVEAWIELTTGWSQADMVSKEISSRRIRKIGQFETPAGPGESVVLNDGRPIKTRLNWLLSEGQGLNFFGYNTGSVAFATTVPVAHVEGKENLWIQ